MKLDFEQRQRSGKLADEMAAADELGNYADVIIYLRDEMARLAAPSVAGTPAVASDVQRKLIGNLLTRWELMTNDFKSVVDEQERDFYAAMHELVKSVDSGEFWAEPAQPLRTPPVPTIQELAAQQGIKPFQGYELEMPGLTDADIDDLAGIRETNGLESAAREIARELLDTMETCHICHAYLVLPEYPVHCEDCSADCDNHDGGECTPIYILHARLKKALELERHLHSAGGRG